MTNHLKEENSHPPQDRHAFSNLRRHFVIAMAAIAIAVVVSQVSIQRFLDNLTSDSTYVNNAGRQRMLSQRLSKEALQLMVAESDLQFQQLAESIQQTTTEWKTFHNNLVTTAAENGFTGNNSESIQDRVADINPAFNSMVRGADQLVTFIENGSTAPELIQPHIQTILENEEAYLLGMEAIVDQAEQAAVQKAKRLKWFEIFLTSFILLLILLEVIFVFMPLAAKIKSVVGQLLVSEEKARLMALNADQLSQEKDKSVRELKVLNQAINHTLFFARVHPDGEIVELGERFSRKFNIRSGSHAYKIQNLIFVEQADRNQFEQLLQQNSRTNWQGEVKGKNGDDEVVWMQMSLIPYHLGDRSWEILIIAVDITSRKEAQLEIERLTNEKFESQMSRQKYISGKIIENQEQEQNRIAKDIHDGIGQMLTALSLNLESIDPLNQEKTAEKIGDLKILTDKIIKGVRTATFNLMPPELSDHGLVPALTKLAEELGKLTGKTIFLYDKTGFDHRLDSLMEINIYRLTQEALNNAIKYADSSQIIVTVSHSEDILSINVDDNGKGFDLVKVPSGGKGEGGMGLTYMRERVKYINGRLFINSTPGKGTRVSINIPIVQ
ncbi:MAG TPA: ATP-binding protein [Membranihabitans sp.]|nr:ATP-binding protein [Membranihabitans sp.]